LDSINHVPDLHLLIAFERVASLGSVAQAAVALNVTPGAVSLRLKRLEQQLALVLFERTSNRIQLTAQGQAYLRDVQTALKAVATLTRWHVEQGTDQRASAKGGPVSRRANLRVNLASPPTFARELLVPRLGEFTTRFPDIDVDLQVSVPLSAEPISGIVNMDLQIRFGNGSFPGFVAEPLLDEAVFPVASAAYLKKLKDFDAHKPQTLANARFLTSPLEPWAAWLAKAKLDWPEPSSGTRMFDLGMLLDAATKGQGVTLARATLARAWLVEGKLIAASHIKAKSPYAYYVTYKPEVKQREEVVQMLRWLKRVKW
jgi:LysR family transcriptional regulator, glycine cleavage system transcriptional activator